MKPVAGELRKSQVISTFGVGGMVDLPAMSTVLMGLDFWNRVACREIDEQRLLRAVREQLGRGVREIREGPTGASSRRERFPAAADGVPVSIFPRWLRCPLCSVLAPVDSGHFALRQEPYHVDRMRYIHVACNNRGGLSDSSMPGAVPARFVIACENGHLDDFPWVDYVHRKPCAVKPLLRLTESGVSGQAADVWVQCDAPGCGQRRQMSEAFTDPQSPRRVHFPCTGHHPHLRTDEQCEAEEATPILIGASNSYFPLVLSAFSLPPRENSLPERIRAVWGLFKDVQEASDIRFMRRKGELGEFEAFADDLLLSAVEIARSSPAPAGDALDLKRPEWDLFSSGRTIATSNILRMRETEVPRGFERWIERVVLIERHREVRALIGFTRLESTGDLSELDTLPDERRGPLSRHPPRWVPGAEMRGEGIFVQLREDAVAAWERGSAVRSRELQLLQAHKNWCEERPWMANDPQFPGARFALLHSLSHALLREFGIRCGYGTASIRERLYSALPSDEGGPMAGILLATASPDSEGTLGGLVALGRASELGSLLRIALERDGICASDPMCATYRPERLSNLHGSACHSCSFVPETSCERSNRYLDRALLTRTMSGLGTEFFEHSR